MMAAMPRAQILEAAAGCVRIARAQTSVKSASPSGSATRYTFHVAQKTPLTAMQGAVEMLREHGVFCVNTLGADAEAIADMFAGRSGAQSEARFQVGAWGTLTTGAPVLTTAVVALDCRILEIKAVASHNVIFGAIQAIHMGPAGPALVYHDRAYKRV